MPIEKIKIVIRRHILVLFLLSISFHAFTQTTLPKNWHLLNVEKDSVFGIDLPRAYQYLAQHGIRSTPVLVGVIDSGVDTAHEDLKAVLWKNPKEIPNNGIDDDKNGYIDDMYGWNFLGGKNGNNVNKTSDERSRVYHLYKDKYLDKKIDSANWTEKETYQYHQWAKSAKEIEVSEEDANNIAYLEMVLERLKSLDEVIQSDIGKTEYSFGDLDSLVSNKIGSQKAKLMLLNMVNNFKVDLSTTNKDFFKEMENYLEGKLRGIEAKDKAPEDLRTTVIHDNYWDIRDKYYGNNDVMAAESNHGTHVTGIIAADRQNAKGIEGIAENVKIITIRAVPDGDEYDKDVALAIFYAVDNGAKVINMSFGKSYSPQKKWVDSAIQYAAQKDVLIVHAAGNDSKNIDSNFQYPTPFYGYDKKLKAENFMTVGASSPLTNEDTTLAADFSNYGVETVDIFAPGVKIYSTLPGGNKYGKNSGTSMAAPVVTGVAALIRSYFPKLTAIQVKSILENSAYTIEINNKPTQIRKLASLSKSGGIVNAYKAVVLAHQRYQQFYPTELNPSQKLPKQKKKKR